MAAASSSRDIVPLKYDVFLSFSGVDTRKGFTNTLFDFLKSKGIETFIDDGLPKGQQIEASLVKTIKESMIAVVVFSKKYASSSWCLDELVRMREFNLIIMPIFYEVKPKHVLELSGKFGEEFAKLESTENKTKIQRWSNDLAFAATQIGWDMDHYRKEIDVIKEVAAHILKYLDSIFISTCPDEFSRYIGIASLMDDLQRKLTNKSSGIQFLGLWGMGGSGKTTIAEVLYHRLSSQFDDSYFCSIALDVKDVYTLVALRNGIISHILNETFDEGTPNQPRALVLSRLRKMKVLIVLDNVSTSDQVTTLIGSKANPWFASGSKIIVTSRDFKVLENEDMTICEIEQMSKDFSLRLFCLHAFKQNQPPDDKDYVRLCNAMVDYSKGLPLALKVLGRHLYRRPKVEWGSTLEAIRTCMDPEIETKLMISYNVLSKTDKELFLDIACFFKGWDKDHVKDILDGCGFKAPIGIAHLIEKCLVTINSDNTFGMHDLLQHMGRNIVEEQSRLTLGKSKRIWQSIDSYNLLKSYQEAKSFEETTKKIEGIYLNMAEDGIKELNIHPMIFSKMQNLRLLIIQETKGHLKIHNGLGQHLKDFDTDEGIQFLPSGLSLLYWDSYPGKFLPSSFSAENLVELNMRASKLRRLWKGVKDSVNLKSLKVLNLEGSKCLITLPDLTSAVKLQKITLDGCNHLRGIPTSIQHLQSLSILSLCECKRLRKLPSLVNISTLRKLNLYRCKGLKEFPETSKDIEELILSETSMVQWPNSMSCLNNLKVLALPSNLQNLPCTLHLNSLENLTFTYYNIQILPKIIGQLRDPSLRWIGIRESPSLILLSSLIKLDLRSCYTLKSLPNNFGQLNCLEKLQLSGCNVLFEEPLVLSGLCCIKELYLDFCKLTEFPAWVCNLSSLQLLDLSWNDFVSVPDGIRQLPLLKVLNLSHCEHLQTLPTELPWLTTSSDITDGELLEAHGGVHQFCFSNCKNLGEGARRNIMEKAMMRIQHIANREDEVSRYTLTVSLPENKIPEFVEHRGDSSVTVELPTDLLCSSMFRGLVVCFILYDYCSDVNLKCTLETADGSYLCSFDWRINIGSLATLGTLCLHYLPSRVIRKHYKQNNLLDATHATFRFVGSYPTIHRLKVSCGVNLVYADDYEDGNNYC